MRLTDAVFARMVVDVRSLLDTMPPEQKADIDSEFLIAIAEQPNEILKCAMYLLFGYLEGAGHAVAEAPLPTCHGDAILMKATAASPTAA